MAVYQFTCAEHRTSAPATSQALRFFRKGFFDA